MTGERCSFVFSNAETSATAAGAGDNSAVTGAIIDRAAYNYPKELVVGFSYTTTLAAGKNLFLKTVIVEHDDASNLGSAATLATAEDATGHSIATSAGGGTVTGVKKYYVSLRGCKRYFRIKFTPDLDASGTDTAKITPILMMSDVAISPAI